MVELFRKILNSPWFTWILLCLPAPALIADLFERNRYYAEIMYESGLLATQLLVLTLVITPLMRLCRNWATGLVVLRWLLRRRRYIGVAAFGYALLHAVFYVRHVGTLELVWLELEEWELATGWLAIVPMALLALTSNSWSVNLFGRWWKSLQKTVYWVALFTALHWLLIDQFLQDMVVLFLPLALLQLWRMIRAISDRTI